MDALAYEKLGEFYLGHALKEGQPAAPREPILYDSRDLTTHAVCMGMTGSGKTGLCIGLLEEAALDGIPAIAIDPKGDLANLLLTFPDLAPSDFEPWLDEGEVRRRGVTRAALAEETAQRWRSGLAESQQDGARIRRLRETCDLAVYTPGSRAGIPLAVLRSFTAPDAGAADDAEGLRERVQSSVSGLLGLIGKDADPLKSRDHILLSQIVAGAWARAETLDLAGLIERVQNPGFDRIGVFELDAYYPAKERLELAMELNHLLASPGAAALAEGEPLEIPRLLFTAEGKPRVAVISIAHLSDAQRMFFVTRLLAEFIAWMRSQPGTSSLRALLYMDEIFGYFPPTAVPPSKPPMLTLLKQARAFGVGIVLATQNPVDLDYKGLANCGTWFIGRLQTERDKLRVLDGLEGAASSSGHAFDRQRMDALLSGLKSRVFLLNNVHESGPVLFETRWTLSFLRGPMTREEIRQLMAGRVPTPEARAAEPSASAAGLPAAVAAATEPARDGAPRPALPDDVPELFWPVASSSDPGVAPVVYRPHLLARVRVHYVQTKAALDAWHDVTLIAPVPEGKMDVDWERSTRMASEAVTRFTEQAGAGVRYAVASPALTEPKSYVRWKKAVAAHVYRSQPLVLYQAPELKQVSKPGESLADFRARLLLAGREGRDQRFEKVKTTYAKKLATAHERVRRAHERVAAEHAQAADTSMDAAFSVGAGVLGAVLGRKVVSMGNVSRARSAVRAAGRVKKERDDRVAAEQALADAQAQYAALEAEFRQRLADLEQTVGAPGVEELHVPPRKSDIEVAVLACAWIP